VPLTAPGRSSSPGGLGLDEHLRSGPRGREPDRHVDQERHPPAVDVEAEQVRVQAGQPAAEHEADGSADPGHGGVHGERAVARGAGREVRGDQREGGRRGERRAQALQAPGAEQHQLVLGEAAEP
jgi:hypothetical protein